MECNKPMPLSQELLADLARIDTPTVCNVIELFDVRPRNLGFTDHRIRCNFPELGAAVGVAATASFRSSSPPAEGDAYGDLSSQLEQFERLDGPPMVVFQDLDDPAVGAVFGEVMCSMYQAFGAVGLVTNGGGRDLQQVRRLGFPVFTGSTICSHAYCHVLHIGLPVRVGGLDVQTGNLLHADENGVAEIPRAIAERIPDAAREFIAAEAIMLDYLHDSQPKSRERFAALRAEFQARVAALKERLRQNG